MALGGFRVSGFGFRVSGLMRVCVSKRVWEWQLVLGFRVSGFGFRI
jgi:hypothetical protein